MTYRATHENKNRVKQRRLLTWCAAGLLVFLAGCSFSVLAYRYADRLILWELDHYFKLTSEQRQDLSLRLKSLLARHRHEAIPQYEAFLVQTRRRLEQGLTSQDIDWIYATYDRLRADLFDRLVEDGGIFLASIDRRQVQTLEAALQKDNDKAVRLVKATPVERLKKRANGNMDLLKDWLGGLSKDQEVQIHEWSLALPDTQPGWVAYQQQRQQELLAVLHQPRTPERAAGELRTIFVYPDHPASPDHQEAVRQMRAAVKTMALAIDQRLTTAQRRHAVTKLQRLIDQLHELRVD